MSSIRRRVCEASALIVDIISLNLSSTHVLHSRSGRSLSVRAALMVGLRNTVIVIQGSLEGLKLQTTYYRLHALKFNACGDSTQKNESIYRFVIIRTRLPLTAIVYDHSDQHPSPTCCPLRQEHGIADEQLFLP